MERPWIIGWSYPAKYIYSQNWASSYCRSFMIHARREAKQISGLGKNNHQRIIKWLSSTVPSKHLACSCPFELWVKFCDLSFPHQTHYSTIFYEYITHLHPWITTFLGCVFIRFFTFLIGLVLKSDLTVFYEKDTMVFFGFSQILPGVSRPEAPEPMPERQCWSNSPPA